MNADLSTTDVLLIAGKPLNVPVVHYGPFVMNTQEEILKAMRIIKAVEWDLLTPSLSSAINM